MGPKEKEREKTVPMDILVKHVNSYAVPWSVELVVSGPKYATCLN